MGTEGTTQVVRPRIAAMERGELMCALPGGDNDIDIFNRSWSSSLCSAQFDRRSGT